MQLSTISDWCGVVGGLAIGTSWLWKLQTWARAKVAEARSMAHISEQLISELLNQATNSGRRADIYAFINFTNVHIEGGRIRRMLDIIWLSFALVAAGCLLFFIYTFYSSFVASWQWWLLITTYIMAALSVFRLAFTVWRLNTMQSALTDKADSVLREKAFEHLPQA